MPFEPVKVITAVASLQTVAVPKMVAVGNGLTVTVAVELICLLQLAVQSLWPAVHAGDDDETFNVPSRPFPDASAAIVLVDASSNL